MASSWKPTLRDLGAPVASAPASKRTSALLDLLNDQNILEIWRFRARTRATLASLDDRALDDLGLDRDAANAEAAKPFWRA